MHEIFVPGRLCLLGEHSDWAASYRPRHPEIARGMCLVAGTNQGLQARARRLEREVVIHSRAPGERVPRVWRAAAVVEELAVRARDGGYFSYVAGVAAEVLTRHPVGGLEIVVDRADLPVRKGLSSSAAIGVLVARAYGLAWNLGLDLRQEMELAYAGERRTGSECGRMDQICALGPGTALMSFDGEAVEFEPVHPGAPFHLLIVDLRRGKDTRRILADLNACFPATPGDLAARVRLGLGPRSADLVARAASAVALGSPESLGHLMSEAQRSFDDLVAPACPELRAPRLHQVLALGWLRSLSLGGKGVGSQGDGCLQLVARDPEARDHIARRLEREEDCGCLPLDLHPGRSVDALPDPNLVG